MGEGRRIDRWLWCVRLYKTRSMAAKAVAGGHVRLNGERTKPAREVRIGDVLRIVRSPIEREVVVRGLPERRGSASIAAQAYEETVESCHRREKRQAELRANALSVRAPTRGKPDKKTRRLMRERDRRVRTDY
jgi:ribosome-associated heat shock protein Hsp15